MHTELILVILTAVFGFYMAWNIGANDVSNAMGTSVGSKALTLKKAVILAAILEFSGAFLMGSHVSSTIQKGIIDPQVFSFDPILFGIGMIGALLATGFWLNIASYFHLPVSTTHAIIGSVLGFGAIIGGLHAVHWGQTLYIGLSWIVAPILSGYVSYFLFLLLQKRILYALNPIQSTKKLTPFLVFFIFAIFVFSIIFKGTTNLQLHLSFFPAFFISIGIGLICAFISILLLKKLPDISPTKKHLHAPYHVVNLEKAAKHLQRIKLSSYGEKYDKTAEILEDLKKLSQDVQKEVEYTTTTTDYKRVEKIFSYLQILSACSVAFAHGANDVANAIGPVAAVAQVIKTGVIPEEFFVPSSILFLGGIGIVIGLATWGWRVIATIGHKITELTPTRGFSAEIGAAATIIFASKLGLPISTTHALVGSVLGVGFARGLRAINLKTIRDIVLSWIVTIPVCAILSIILFYLLKAIFK